MFSRRHNRKFENFEFMMKISNGIFSFCPKGYFCEAANVKGWKDTSAD